MKIQVQQRSIRLISVKGECFKRYLLNLPLDIRVNALSNPRSTTAHTYTAVHVKTAAVERLNSE